MQEKVFACTDMVGSRALHPAHQMEADNGRDIMWTVAPQRVALPLVWNVLAAVDPETSVPEDAVACCCLVSMFLHMMQCTCSR